MQSKFDLPMEFTGERFIPEVHGSIELEHLHRYILACEITKGKTVLDIACGEGYGSAIIANDACRVYGVDLSVDAVRHARKRYGNKENLEYMVGDCCEIPLPDSSVDVVISFETIEHHDMHQLMMKEIKRVLNVNGVLLISSPDKYHYSEENSYSNPYHVKELYEYEFKQLIDQYFNNALYYGQRVLYGSGIFSESSNANIKCYSMSGHFPKGIHGIIKPTYWLAIASDYTLPSLSNGVLEQTVNESDVAQHLHGAVAERDLQIANLHKDNLELNQQISDLYLAVKQRNEQIIVIEEISAEQKKIIYMRDGEIKRQKEILANAFNSSSWKLTKPLRIIGSYIRVILRKTKIVFF